MKTVIKKFPIYAGQRSGKLRKVGTYTMEFKYMVHPDGDEQLVSEKEISRKLFKR